MVGDIVGALSVHVVLDTADSTPYASVRGRPIPREQRRALGKALRREAPRSVLGAWVPAADRRDPIDLLTENHEGRIDWLVPVRVGRMVASGRPGVEGTSASTAATVSPAMTTTAQ